MPIALSICSGVAPIIAPHVVDLVGLEAEHLGEAAADLVRQHHALERPRAVPALHLRRGDRHGIEVVVPELAGREAELLAVAEVRAVGVPFAHRRAVGDDRLLGRHLHGAAEERHAVLAAVLERLLPQQHRGVRAERDRADAAQDAVGVEELGALLDQRARAGVVHEVAGELADSEGLV
jgi:hypothetical protein